jgi:phage shock protein PspC (stress-responsive transcriptional regulator)
MDLVLMRVLWLVFALGTGVGFLVYIAAWIALPSDAGFPPQAFDVIARPPLSQRR